MNKERLCGGGTFLPLPGGEGRGEGELFYCSPSYGLVSISQILHLCLSVFICGSNFKYLWLGLRCPLASHKVKISTEAGNEAGHLQRDFPGMEN